MQKEVRIVVPAFKASKTIGACINAVLEAMSFHASWEIVIVDNGQNPDMKHLLKDYPVKIIECHEKKSAAYARNEGARDFIHGILVFLDSDVICEKDCIQNLIKPVHENRCNASIGNYSKNMDGLTFSQKYKQLYINHIYNRESTSIKNDFWSAICSIDANVFHKLNGFNTKFKGANGEDQEFGIRLTQCGCSILSVKNANGQHLNPYGVVNIIKNDFRKGLTAVHNSFENKVPLSDNRHSKGSDMLAVFFTVLAICFLMVSFLNYRFLYGFVFSLLSWFTCRIQLSSTFLSIGGVFFFIKSIILMFLLDQIRFICVIAGFVQSKFIFLFSSKSKNQIYLL